MFLSLQRFVAVLSTFLLSSSSLIRLAHACSNPNTNFWDSLRQDGAVAHLSKDSYLKSQQVLVGLSNSACNKAQRQYIELEKAYIAALYMDSMCYDTFYVSIKTPADVNPWLTCEALALPVLFGATAAQQALQAASSDDLGAQCPLCLDAPYPPASIPIQLTDPQHVWGIQTIMTTLDWTNKLYNIQTLGLKEGLKSIVKEELTSQVPQGVGIGLQDWVSAVVTKGFPPPASLDVDASVGGALQKREANATAPPPDPAWFQLMNSTTEITVTVKMVALEPNYTYAQLEQGIKDVLGGANFSSKLAKLSATVTGSSFSTRKPVASEVSTVTGTATGSASTGKASGSAQKGGVDGRRWDGVGGVVGLIVGMGVVFGVLV